MVDLRVVKDGQHWRVYEGAEIRAAYKRERDADRLIEYVTSGGARSDLLSAHHAQVVADLRRIGSESRLRSLLLPRSDDGFHCPTWILDYLDDAARSRFADEWCELTDAVAPAPDLLVGLSGPQREHVERLRGLGLLESVRTYVNEIREREAQQAEQTRRDEQNRLESEQATERRAAAAEQSRIVARTQVERLLRETAERRNVEVVTSTSFAGDTEIPWSEWPGAVSWRAWARPDDERLGTMWDRAVASLPERVAEVAAIRDCQERAAAQLRFESKLAPLTRVWTQACANATSLPALFDLSGVPVTTEGGLWPLASWLDALHVVLRRVQSGVTLIVAPPVQAWALDRVLPSRTGVAL